MLNPFCLKRDDLLCPVAIPFSSVLLYLPVLEFEREERNLRGRYAANEKDRRFAPCDRLRIATDAMRERLSFLDQLVLTLRRSDEQPGFLVRE